MLRGIWGWAKIAPLEGRADALGHFEKVQTSRLWPSSKKQGRTLKAAIRDEAEQGH